MAAPASDGREGLPAAVTTTWSIRAPTLLARRDRTHWRVDADGGPAVLRRWGGRAEEDGLRYERHLTRLLRDAGWPAPAFLAEPLHADGRWWDLLELLPGTPRDDEHADRDRGRLLAELHASTAAFPATSRPSFPPVLESLRDPALPGILRRIESRRPETGGELLRHLDLALEHLESLDPDALPRALVHGDAASRNLLFSGDRLTGLLDLELAHPDVRVAEFAIAWRATRDDVLRGYEEVSPLSGDERRALHPVLWAWALAGVATVAGHAGSVTTGEDAFAWQTDTFRRRSALVPRPDETPPA